MPAGSAHANTCGPTRTPPTMRITTWGMRSRESNPATMGVNAAITATIKRSTRLC